MRLERDVELLSGQFGRLVRSLKCLVGRQPFGCVLWEGRRLGVVGKSICCLFVSLLVVISFLLYVWWTHLGSACDVGCYDR